ncbi:anhydro-N-acetylmuramic acid kinase [Nafulsella turpanensis]|uniref:anhydro-N-acetylmuramic acid kinase n=1 Tax=Nafulsella turpanensis TaxID=1265690 RepID=UPI000344C135|nr:anhydro-N-acetylmuramic acid kinase [Nafulsella turpanensis]
MAETTASYTVLGVMSGTSLDGLDLACCHLEKQGNGYQFHIQQATTIPYSAAWQHTLGTLVHSSALELQEAHINLGRYIGQEVRKFMEQHQLKPELVSSHGHTIFHQPQKGFSLQIGDGYHIMVESGCPVANDFRSLDIALGGQGAPLVPVGDELLFGTYDFCLNLGGIANVSARRQGKRVAFDICPVNMVLNYLAKREGQAYDAGGEMAAKGKKDDALLQKLNSLDFYRQEGPKSLGYEWVNAAVFPMLESATLSTNDLLHTFCLHIAEQLYLALLPLAPVVQKQKLLLTGGGAFNTFLIDLLKEKLEPLNIMVVVPERQIIEYKEALIFALLGVLRLRGEINCLASVTGARRNSCGGQLYGKI